MCFAASKMFLLYSLWKTQTLQNLKVSNESLVLEARFHIEEPNKPFLNSNSWTFKIACLGHVREGRERTQGARCTPNQAAHFEIIIANYFLALYSFLSSGRMGEENIDVLGEGCCEKFKYAMIFSLYPSRSRYFWICKFQAFADQQIASLVELLQLKGH